MTRIFIAALLAAACIASAQDGNRHMNHVSTVIWEPPTLEFPDVVPHASVSGEMITTLHVGEMDIILDQTPLSDVQKRLGGTLGQRGDASKALHWLCFYGTGGNGSWALWLESDEMGGGSVDSFALQRIDRSAKPDKRCAILRGAPVNLPMGLDVGLPEVQVGRILGTPTVRYRDTLIFGHEHEETIRDERFTVSNTVAVALRGGVVRAIQVWKSTNN
jgi:hypothetical protein